MGLFGKKKKEQTCSCGGACTASAAENADAAVKVLGSGCAKCNELEQATREALAELGMDTTIAPVTDFAQIAVTTPALVVDGKVVSYGKVLSKEQVKTLIEQARGAK